MKPVLTLDNQDLEQRLILGFPECWFGLAVCPLKITFQVQLRELGGAKRLKAINTATSGAQKVNFFPPFLTPSNNHQNPRVKWRRKSQTMVLQCPLVAVLRNHPGLAWGPAPIISIILDLLRVWDGLV